MGFDIIEEVNKMAEGRNVIAVRKLPDGRHECELDGTPEEIWKGITVVSSCILAAISRSHPLMSRGNIAAICGDQCRCAVDAAILLFLKGIDPDSNVPAQQ